MIILDTNQKATSIKLADDLLPLLEAHTGVLVDVLDSADVAHQGRSESGRLDVSFGYELKKYPQDLMASMRDGRLLDQLQRMTEEYDFPYVVLIGKAVEINFKTGRVREIKKRSWVDSPYGFHHLNSVLSKF